MPEDTAGGPSTSLSQGGDTARWPSPIVACRTLAVAVFLVGYTLVVGPSILLWSWLRGSAGSLYAVGKAGVRVALWLAGIVVEVRGVERLRAGRTYLFMPNHQSNVDPPVLLLVLRRDVRFMTKAELFRIPLLGRALYIAGFVPVARDKRERAIAAVEEAVAALRSGRDFVVFPEGTRSRDGRLLPLKKGPFYLAIGAQVPVVPVVVRGTRDLMHKGSPWIHPGHVRVDVLEPLETEGMSLQQRDDLRVTVQGVLLSKLEVAGG